jgi:hypothetical protein
MWAKRKSNPRMRSGRTALFHQQLRNKTTTCFAYGRLASKWLQSATFLYNLREHQSYENEESTVDRKNMVRPSALPFEISQETTPCTGTHDPSFYKHQCIDITFNVQGEQTIQGKKNGRSKKLPLWPPCLYVDQNGFIQSRRVQSRCP